MKKNKVGGWHHPPDFKTCYKEAVINFNFSYDRKVDAAHLTNTYQTFTCANRKNNNLKALVGIKK